MKTKYLRISLYNQGAQRPIDTINTHNFQAVDDFVYLASLVRTDGSTSHKIKRKVLIANRAYHALKLQLTSHRKSRKTRFQLNSNLIKSVLLYDSES